MGLIIKNKAQSKIKEYAIQVGNSEIGGLLCGSIKDGSIIIKDAVILSQEKSGGSFEIDDKALMDITKEASTKFLESIIGWWHSHSCMGAFWSGTDDDTFKRLCEFSNICVGIVVSKRGLFGRSKIHSRNRIDIKDRNNNYLSLDDLNMEFEDDKFKINKKNIVKEIRKKVKDIKFNEDLNSNPNVDIPNNIIFNKNQTIDKNGKIITIPNSKIEDIAKYPAGVG
jgi:proteasome lid subunit RPN8/RPN11